MPTEPPRIRPCLQSDFESVVALLAQLWPDVELRVEPLRQVWARALASDEQAFLCAVDGDNVVGFASLAIQNTLWAQGLMGHLDELVVDHEHRGNGLGERLLAGLVEIARSRGCVRIELQTGNHRPFAHRFYEKHGFQDGEARTYFKLL